VRGPDIEGIFLDDLGIFNLSVLLAYCLVVYRLSPEVECMSLFFWSFDDSKTVIEE
jgi:hypothetical protein